MKKILIIAILTLLATFSFGMDIKTIDGTDKWGNPVNKSYYVMAQGSSYNHFLKIDETVTTAFTAGEAGTFIHIDDALATKDFVIQLKYKNSNGQLISKKVESMSGSGSVMAKLPDDYENGLIEVTELLLGNTMKVIDIIPLEDFSHRELKKYINKK